MCKNYLPVNFDELKELYIKSPDEFELQRLSLISSFIASLPDDAVLRKIKGLQFKIDMERRKSKNPYDSCVRLNKLLRIFLEEEFILAVNLTVKNRHLNISEADSNNVVNLTKYKSKHIR